jgi:hypothetical protein
MNMLTKVEQRAELDGVNNARPVYAMTPEQEALHYVRMDMKDKVKRADEDATKVIRHIEDLFASGKGDLQNRGRELYTFPNILKKHLSKYELNVWQINYAAKQVMLYFRAVRDGHATVGKQ